jgi:hypothetical protein
MATSYSNTGGQGDRTAIITVTRDVTYVWWFAAGLIVDGSAGRDNTHGIILGNGSAVSGKYIQFDFGVGASKLIDEMQWVQSAGGAQGTWKVQGSNNGADWTDIGSDFTLGSTTTTTIDMSANIVGYRYYRLLGVSGNSNNGVFCDEANFKIDDYVAPPSLNVDGITAITSIDGVAVANIKAI